jgi:GTPase SAR1 family protein
MAVSWPESEDSNSSGKPHKQLTIAFLGAKSVGKTSLIKVRPPFNDGRR